MWFPLFFISASLHFLCSSYITGSAESNLLFCYKDLIDLHYKLSEVDCAFRMYKYQKLLQIAYSHYLILKKKTLKMKGLSHTFMSYDLFQIMTLSSGMKKTTLRMF